MRLFRITCLYTLHSRQVPRKWHCQKFATTFVWNFFRGLCEKSFEICKDEHKFFTNEASFKYILLKVIRNLVDDTCPLISVRCTTTRRQRKRWAKYLKTLKSLCKTSSHLFTHFLKLVCKIIWPNTPFFIFLYTPYNKHVTKLLFWNYILLIIEGG